MVRLPLAASTIAVLALVAASSAQAQKTQTAHEHGVVRIDVAIEGGTLGIVAEVPLDNLLGFERAPRTDAERKAAADVLMRLRAPAGLFVIDAAAQCALTRAEVKAPVLEAGSKPRDGHADLDAEYRFECKQPAQLRTLELGWFEAFQRIQRIEVQVAGPQGQSKTALRRPARSVRLVR